MRGFRRYRIRAVVMDLYGRIVDGILQSPDNGSLRTCRVVYHGCSANQRALSGRYRGDSCDWNRAVVMEMQGRNVMEILPGL